MDQALADLQTLQNELIGRWTGPPEIGNYILLPPSSQVEEWMALIENVRQALLTAGGAMTASQAPAEDKKAKK